MADANIATLLSAAGCLECLTTQERQLVRLVLLANWLKKIRGF